MLNKVIIMGRITKELEIRQSQSGTAVLRFSVAVDRPQKNGEKSADFISCIAFGQTAEFIGLPFAPKLLILAGTSYSGQGGAPVMIWVAPATTASLGTYYGSHVKVSFNGTNVVLELADGSNWRAGEKYGYIALG